MALYTGVVASYYQHFGMNPHLDPAGPYNPLHLAEKWVEVINRRLGEGPIVVNAVGGWLPKSAVIVLAEAKTEKMRWPAIDDERITISHWPRGRHWYLSSDKGRIFVPDKYATYDAAREASLVYVR